ncbi:MAG: hypothetical protein LBM61_02095 [Prevotellaceae bacterium]|jgi:hypothetical protein|nr:hypothetical protein [Prevotellaceae bacterium]
MKTIGHNRCIFLSIFLLFILLFGCQSRRRDKTQYDETKIAFLNNIIRETDTLSIDKYEKKLFDLVQLLNDKKGGNTAKFTGLIYILNSECSICIGDFIDFAMHLNRSSVNLPIITIIDVGNREAMKYYIEQTGLDKNIDMSFFTNKDFRYIKDALVNHNGRVFYVYKDNIMKSFSYIDDV